MAEIQVGDISPITTYDYTTEQKTAQKSAGIYHQEHFFKALCEIINKARLKTFKFYDDEQRWTELNTEIEESAGNISIQIEALKEEIVDELLGSLFSYLEDFIFFILNEIAESQ